MPAAPPQVRYQSLNFPQAGLVRRVAYEQSEPYSSPSLLNVRPFETVTERARGGSRPGLNSVISGTLGGQPQLLTDILWVDTAHVNNLGQTINYPTATVVGAYQGQLLTLAGQQFLPVVLASGITGLRGDIQLSAIDYRQKLYIAGDASSSHKLCTYTPSSNTLALVTASAGSVPTNNTIVVRHSDRIYLFGDETNPHQWYASAVGDATDWDTGAAVAGAAVSSESSDAGATGEPILAALAHSNQCVIMGGDSSLWMLRGDPAAGGTIANLSTRIGILDRFAWCHDPTGRLWFLTSDGLYTYAPGCYSGWNGQAPPAPDQVSRDKLPEELTHIDRALFQVTMAYDVEHIGIHLYVTPYDSSGTPSHWWFSVKQQAFWPVALTAAHDPFCLFPRRDFVAPTKTESLIWHACRDGGIRRYDEASDSDDGLTFGSFVDFGPFKLGRDGLDGILSELSLVTASGSYTVTLDARAGENAEAAYLASSQFTRSCATGGLNYTVRPMIRGQACVVRVSGSGTPGANEWGFEELLARVLPAGRRRIP